MKPKQSIPKHLRYTVADLTPNFLTMMPALSTSRNSAGRMALPSARSAAQSESITASLAAPPMPAKRAGITFTRSPGPSSRSPPLRSRLGSMPCTSWVRLVAASPQSRSSARLASPTKPRGACSARFGGSCPRMICNWRVRRWRWMRCTTGGSGSARWQADGLPMEATRLR